MAAAAALLLDTAGSYTANCLQSNGTTMLLQNEDSGDTDPITCDDKTKYLSAPFSLYTLKQ
jgi:hypothetical protein